MLRQIILSAALLGIFISNINAKTYFTPEQAQKLIFPNVSFVKFPINLTSEQQNRMTEVSSVKLAFDGSNVWKGIDGSWFIVDQVVGKHEFITYAVGINPSGSIKDIEILEYNESYGYEVKEKSWLKQFFSKTNANPIKLNQDIDNISGATLSCKHLSDGIKRVMTMHEIALKNK
ncbi:MAG: FMN-binding protein [Candidatus Methylopumilus sp.]|jgi:Na+-translocating ferredoxin:NAD+ oxidoreductase RnfG subunit